MGKEIKEIRFKDVHTWDNPKFINFAEGNPDLFQIEYEDEGFEWENKTYTYYDTRCFLNALADWCDAKFPEKDKITNIGLYGMDIVSWQVSAKLQGIKLNNEDSATLFTEQLNLPEFATYKAEFIKMLKSNRL